MAVIFAAKKDLIPSGTQSASGQVTLTASGAFDGATLMIEVQADGQGWAPLHSFSSPGAVGLALVTGQSWRASLANIGATTSINLSAL